MRFILASILFLILPLNVNALELKDSSNIPKAKCFVLEIKAFSKTAGYSIYAGPNESNSFRLTNWLYIKKANTLDELLEFHNNGICDATAVIQEIINELSDSDL